MPQTLVLSAISRNIWGVNKVQWKWPAEWKGGIGKYKYMLLIVLVGIVLLLPSGKSTQVHEQAETRLSQERFDLPAMERRLETALSKIDGAGKVSVVLTLKDGGRQIYAQDIRTDQREQSRTAVIVSCGSGVEQPVPVQSFPPTFQGALAVCPGGGDARVRLQLTQAICALTGLSTENISICQSE